MRLAHKSQKAITDNYQYTQITISTTKKTKNSFICSMSFMSLFCRSDRKAHKPSRAVNHFDSEENHFDTERLFFSLEYSAQNLSFDNSFPSPPSLHFSLALTSRADKLSKISFNGLSLLSHTRNRNFILFVAVTHIFLTIFLFPIHSLDLFYFARLVHE